MKTLEDLIKLLKEIQQGIEGQMIPYNLIKNAINPIIQKGCLKEVLYLLENFKV